MVQTLLNIASPSWLTGPVFDKELRVLSRRRRNYVLRFTYLGLLLILLVLVWLEEIAPELFNFQEPTKSEVVLTKKQDFSNHWRHRPVRTLLKLLPQSGSCTPLSGG